jgi:NDP-sugar pyrophosphorylase family protein
MQHRVPVIILAGGLGTRLWPLFKDRPKPMAEILNKPFLEYIILNLKYQAFTDIILAVSYMKEFVVEYFGDGSEFGVHIKYSVEDVPLGTGGAIKRASMMVDEERFICMNGDTFSDVSLFDLLHYHLAKNAKITLALKAVEDRARYGSVDIDRNGKILTFDEKRFKGAGLINTGVYVFEKSIFEKYPTLIITDVFSPDDWQSWQKFNQIIPKEIYLTGDELISSNKERLEKAIKDKLLSAAIIRPNQISTITEALSLLDLARKNNIVYIILVLYFFN